MRVVVTALIILLVTGTVAAQESAPLMVPPADLYPDAERIALVTHETPAERAAAATYANAADTARAGLTVLLADDPSLLWGRLTTNESVNHAALGLVPAWRTPADFDLAGFLEATGCVDARYVLTDTPRANLTTNAFGWTEDFALPAETPVSGAFVLCRTADGAILQVLSVHRTDAAALDASPVLTGTAAAWLAAGEPGEDPAPPPGTCEPEDGFRVMPSPDEGDACS